MNLRKAILVVQLASVDDCSGFESWFPWSNPISNYIWRVAYGFVLKNFKA